MGGPPFLMLISTEVEQASTESKLKGLVAKQLEKNNEVWSRKGFPNLVVCF